LELGERDANLHLAVIDDDRERAAEVLEKSFGTIIHN
jgi:hypothetical protein